VGTAATVLVEAGATDGGRVTVGDAVAPAVETAAAVAGGVDALFVAVAVACAATLAVGPAFS
jgi:hypothetical protein